MRRAVRRAGPAQGLWVGWARHVTHDSGFVKPGGGGIAVCGDAEFGRGDCLLAPLIGNWFGGEGEGRARGREGVGSLCICVRGDMVPAVSTQRALLSGNRSIMDGKVQGTKAKENVQVCLSPESRLRAPRSCASGPSFLPSWLSGLRTPSGRSPDSAQHDTHSPALRAEHFLYSRTQTLYTHTSLATSWLGHMHEYLIDIDRTAQPEPRKPSTATAASHSALSLNHGVAANHTWYDTLALTTCVPWSSVRRRGSSSWREPCHPACRWRSFHAA